MPANERQVGGDHYAAEYQHWDWVADIKLPYHPATAAKYIDRWESKGTPGLDLGKAKHYLEKTIEINTVFTPRQRDWDSFWNLIFSRRHTRDTARILFYIQQGNWAQALEGIKSLPGQTA